MAEPLKARVHLILTVGDDGDGISFKTDVLCLTRHAEWAFRQGLDAAIRALLVIKLPAHRVKVHSHSIEWLPLGRPDADG